MFDLPIPNGWQLVTLSELGEVNRGRSRHRPRDAEHLYGGPYPFIQTGDVKASSGRITNYTQTYSEEGLKQSRLWPAGTMCITIAANIAETGILSFPACFPDSVIGFIADDKKCNPFFIEYVFRLLRRHIQAQATGSVQDNINLQTLERLHFPVPVLNEQNRIANILCAFDEKIQLNRQINQTLEQMAQAIFQSWFVDFEPVKAKISAREDWLARQAVQRDAHDDAPQFSSPVCYAHEFADAAAPAPATQADLETFINRAAMCVISGKNDADLDAMPAADYQRLYHAASLFPDELVESELGEIPKGWEVDALLERIIITGGGTPKRSEDSYWNGNIPWFSVKDVPADGDVFVIDTDETITELGLQKSSTKILEEGTTIVTARGTVGKLALVGKRMCMNQSCYGISGKNFGPYFNYFNMREAVETLKRNTHGAVFDTITTKTFDTYRSCYPGSSLDSAFDDSVTPLLMQIKNNLEQIKSLTKIREFLLPKLLSGEIVVDPI